MDKGPEQPCRHTGKAKRADLRDCFCAPDGGHAAPIPIDKGLPSLLGDALRDHARDIPCLLHGHGRQSREGMAASVIGASGIADDKDAGLFGDG